MSKQLREWACLPEHLSRPLHVYPELFQEIQERSLVGLNERATELEHLKVGASAKRGQRYMHS